jgi:predicted transcriptional regulator
LLAKHLRGGMWKVLSIKIDPKMKRALELVAEDEFTSVSSIVKKAIAKYLEKKGIDWKKEKKKSNPH